MRNTSEGTVKLPMSRNHNVIYCDVTKRKICEIMGCDKIFKIFEKSIIKSVRSPKMSSLLQFVAEIRALF